MIDFDSRIPFTKEQVEELLLQDHETPFHIYDEQRIRQTARELKAAFDWVGDYSAGYQNFFAVKALPNPRILEILAEEGMGADCSSDPELTLAWRAGISKENIMFTSNDTPDNEFVHAYSRNAIINLDDIKHISALENALQNRGLNFPEFISFRYNPGPKIKGNDIIGDPTKAKYGVPDEQIIDAYRTARAMGAKRFGLHTMMVSNERSEEALIEQARILFNVAARISQHGIDFEFINLGGGIGIPYRPNDHQPDLEKFARGVEQAYKEIIIGNKMNPPRIVTESGRAVTGPHGWLVSRVRHVAKKYREFVGLDACMANLMRPGMYSDDLNPEGECYHHVSVLGKEHAPKNKVYDVTGSLCEGCDVFARQRPLPEIQEGDLVVIHNTGAHGHAMGFNYNGKLRSAEFLLRTDGSFEMIRRHETSKDYFTTLNFPGSKYADLAR